MYDNLFCIKAGEADTKCFNQLERSTNRILNYERMTVSQWLSECQSAWDSIYNKTCQKCPQCSYAPLDPPFKSASDFKHGYLKIIILL